MKPIDNCLSAYAMTALFTLWSSFAVHVGKQADGHQLYAGLLWTMLNSSEFVLNH